MRNVRELVPSLQRAYAALADGDEGYAEVGERLGLTRNTVATYAHKIRSLGLSIPTRKPQRNDDGTTHGQGKILELIGVMTREKGYPPTVREMCVRTGMTSPNGIKIHLDALRALGLVDWNDNEARTLRLTGGKVCPCCKGLGQVFDPKEGA